MKYKVIFESEISGVPCKIGVMSYFVKKPNIYEKYSDKDYYGYIDIEWDLLKFNGKPFEWLENRLTGEDRSVIEDEIRDYVESQEEPDYYEDDDYE